MSTLAHSWEITTTPERPHETRIAVAGAFTVPVMKAAFDAWLARLRPLGSADATHVLRVTNTAFPDDAEVADFYVELHLCREPVWPLGGIAPILRLFHIQTPCYLRHLGLCNYVLTALEAEASSRANACQRVLVVGPLFSPILADALTRRAHFRPMPPFSAYCHHPRLGAVAVPTTTTPDGAYQQ